MTVDNPIIPSADDADLIEQSIDVEGDDSESYPATSRDSIEDEAEAFTPVIGSQRH